jgi:hypothetical protein
MYPMMCYNPLLLSVPNLEIFIYTSYTHCSHMRARLSCSKDVDGYELAQVSLALFQIKVITYCHKYIFFCK